MTDEYPPFRLDLGGSEPSELAAMAIGDRAAGAAVSSVPTAALTTTGGPTPGPTWSTGRILAVVIGSLLLLGGVGAAVGGTVVLMADRNGRDADGFLNTPTRSFTSSGYALVYDPLELRGSASSGDFDAMVGDVRVNATGAAQGGAVFVGIGPTEAVDGYLTSVERDRVVDFRTDDAAVRQRLPGGAPATPPTQQSFWAASATGVGPQQLTWTVTEDAGPSW